MPTAADHATDLLQNMSLDHKKKKAPDVSEVPMKASATSGEAPPVMPSSRANRSAALNGSVDSSMWYPSTAYYYGGYDASITDWKDYYRYMTPEGVGVYGDMHHYGYGYAPYCTYPSPSSTVPTSGHDGHISGTQHYRYPTQYYQSPSTPEALSATSKPSSSQPDASNGISADKSLASDSSKAKAYGSADGKFNGTSVPPQPYPSHQSSSLGSNGSYAIGAMLLSSPYQDACYGFDAMQFPISWYDGSALYGGKQRSTNTGSGTSAAPHVGCFFSTGNQNIHPYQHVMGLFTPRPASSLASTAPAFFSRMYANSQTYGVYGTALRAGFGYGPNWYNTKGYGHWGYATDGKFKRNGRGGSGFYSNGNVNLDGFSEMNKGPRSDRSEDIKGMESNVVISIKRQNISSNGPIDDSVPLPSRDLYNKVDFPEVYSDAKFFIIKSYSEDDVHKSVKYNVWASTPNGNKKLDAAYKEAQENPDGCLIFLLFSVNTSGQFVGVAEMLGPVDFDKTVPYWQQNKWNGCFPLKWHIVKDVPNSTLKHIILDYNDGKPVTNSRDTQEVKLEQGLQMLKIFKDYVSKTCILDDFGFYETRQKLMLEKRAHQAQKQALNAKATDAVVGKDKGGGTNGWNRLSSPLEVVTPLKTKSPLWVPGEIKLLPEENGVGAAGDLAKSPPSENLVVEKIGIVNGSLLHQDTPALDSTEHGTRDGSLNAEMVRGRQEVIE